MSTTNWKLFAANEEAWLAMLSDCAKAQRSIVLEQFIFNDDEIGRKFINVCTERAQAGVKIRFLWDAAGSFTFFGTDITEELKQKGIELRFWKTLIPSYFKLPNIRSWFLRNHRRTLVIDEEIGYTGSICVSGDKFKWRDTNMRLEGPMVKEMANAFDRMWARSNKSNKMPKRRFAKDPEFRYVTNYPAPGRRHMYSATLNAIKKSRHYIYITTPYFIPTHRMVRALKDAAKRGVDVVVIMPEKTDHYPALDLGSRSFFTTLFNSGVRIFLYPSAEGGFIHSKTMVVDGVWGTVGSMNLDSVSLLYNFEANVVTNNTKCIEELTAHFVRDMNRSMEVDRASWKSRYFLEKVPEILIKLVRKFL